MFGGKWEPITGNVIERRHVGSVRNEGEQSTPSYKYVVEVTLADGSTQREELGDTIGMRQLTLSEGQQVALLHDKRGTSLKWDKDDSELKVARGIVDLDQFRGADGKVTREQLMDLAKRTPATPSPKAEQSADGRDSGAGSNG